MMCWKNSSRACSNGVGAAGVRLRVFLAMYAHSCGDT
jgi:hypothetical protein